MKGSDRRKRQEEMGHDPYQKRFKPQQPFKCDGCGVVFADGHWSWTSPEEVRETGLCPACERTRDSLPAGTLRLTGAYLEAHRDEIENLIHNEEAAEKGQRPLNRVMTINEIDGGIEIATTDIHLPRRLGEAVHHAHKGDLDIQHQRDEYAIRVLWHRD